jgi:hypothetical protein
MAVEYKITVGSMQHGPDSWPVVAAEVAALVNEGWTLEHVTAVNFSDDTPGVYHYFVREA